MGLLPDKPNPVRRSIANPSNGTRVCTHCYHRQLDEHFRWLWINKRKASQCKACEKLARQKARLHALPPTMTATA